MSIIRPDPSIDRGGCESDRTAFQLSLTSCSTDRNVPSSLNLFFSKINVSQHATGLRRFVTRCHVRED